MTTSIEPWLRGPVAGVDAYLQPAAHALQQAAEDFERSAHDLTPDELWIMPGGAASVGFHLRHVAGSVDRLLTYARGEALSDAQRAAIPGEGTPGVPRPDAGTLIRGTQAAIAHAIDVMRATPRATLLEPRAVGRKALPSTVLGLLFHVAEHTQRHSGQCLVTCKVIRGARAAGAVGAAPGAG